MTVLGIDCSSSIMSVSLKQDKRLFEFSIQDGFKNSENLMPMIDSAFRLSSINPSDLDLVAVASGPGSFTGLRIAMATAKGIAMGSDCPVVSVPTLDSYASCIEYFNGAIIPVIDAKKQRFYASIYKQGEKKTVDMDISIPDLLKLAEPFQPVLITGPDAGLLSDSAGKTTGIYLDHFFSSTSATKIIDLGIKIYENKGADPKGSGPVYIRKSEAEISMFGE